MYTNPKIQEAMNFALQVHEIDQKQKRKGKDIPYIVHPYAVGMILASIGASIDVICAGILHDTIEDSIPEKKVTREILETKFGPVVATCVADVSEKEKKLSWEERKRAAIEHIRSFSQESLLVKSADVLSNAGDILKDYSEVGEEVFSRFNAPKERVIEKYLNAITTILETWEGNPLADNLRYVRVAMANILVKNIELIKK